MKLLKSLWIFLMSIFLLVACGEDSAICNPEPVLTTSDVSSVTDVSAILNGKIIAPECGESVTSQGFVYSTAEFPKITDSYIEVSGEEISNELKNLQQNTTYYYRTYFTNVTGTYYGDQKSFSTEVGESNSNSSVIGVSATSATVRVEVTSNGGGEISSQGVCWSTNNMPTIADSKIESTGVYNTFTSILKGLAADTTYYIRSYATNVAGTSYGEVKSFTTLDGVVTFSSVTISSLTTSTTNVSYSISNNGGAEITKYGICWSKNPNPTLSNSSVIDGGENGVFSSVLSDMVFGTTYYIRAYATNSTGTYYGIEKNYKHAATVGDERAGGIVFYIAPEPTDLDGDGDLDTGLVCATEDQSSGVSWSYPSNSETGATATLVGSGATNTATIIAAAQGGRTYAVSLVSDYEGGGFDDWFLPSKDELNLMYVNLKSKGLGGFTGDMYWSSTEHNSARAWGQFFNNGNQNITTKKMGDLLTPSVRAVRAF